MLTCRRSAPPPRLSALARRSPPPTSPSEGSVVPPVRAEPALEHTLQWDPSVRHVADDMHHIFIAHLDMLPVALVE